MLQRGAHLVHTQLSLRQTPLGSALCVCLREMSVLQSQQPSKLKFLLGRHLATNSFGLGRLINKSSRQLQNFRRHGDQNGRNLEG